MDPEIEALVQRGDVEGLRALPLFTAIVDDANFFDLRALYSTSDDDWIDDRREKTEREAWAAMKTILLRIGAPAEPVLHGALAEQHLGRRRHRWLLRADLDIEGCIAELAER
jgi:hypothetical protein